MIEWFSKVMSAALVGNNFSPIPQEISSLFCIKKKRLVMTQNLQTI